MADSTIQFLRDLIAINSVNPSLVSGTAGENQIGAAIANKLRAGGLDVQLEQLTAGRSNVIGVVEGKQKGRSRAAAAAGCGLQAVDFEMYLSWRHRHCRLCFQAIE